MIKTISKENAITAYKGFKDDFSCLDFQYKVGNEYHINGDVEMCENGFHACKDLMDVFNYYLTAPVYLIMITILIITVLSGNIKMVKFHIINMS